MTSNHTPGPWAISKCRCGHPSCNQWILSNQGSVGFEEADARLIAEAPAMLEALREAEEAFTADNSYYLLRAHIRTILARIDGE